MGFYCALKCVGTVLDTEKVKMSKIRTPPCRSSLSAVNSVLSAGREREPGRRQRFERRGACMLENGRSLMSPLGQAGLCGPMDLRGTEGE